MLLRFMHILRTRSVETCHVHEQGGVDVPTMQPAAHATIKIFLFQSHATKFPGIIHDYHSFCSYGATRTLRAPPTNRQNINTILEVV